MDDLEKNIKEDRDSYVKAREDHQEIDHSHVNEEEKPRTREVASSISPAYRVNKVYSEPTEETAVAADRTVNKAAQVVYYITGVVVALLGLRFLLLLFGATNTGFVNFIYQLTEPLVVPFRGIFADVPMTGAAVLEVASLFSMLVMVVVGYIVAGFFRLLSRDTTAV
jgi:uncharacterized protein YggT (Ycf19 family)